MTTDYRVSGELAHDLRYWHRLTLAIGVAFFIASAIGALFSPQDFFRSYLVAYLFWIGLTLGSLAMLMLQYLTGGAWGVVSRRTFEAASRTMPLIIVLFIPLAIGIPYLYDWAHPELVRREFVLQHRSGYMNPPMFILRACAYFTIWMVLTYFLNKWSANQDRDGGRQPRLAALSAPGLILYVFTITFAAVDWAESLTTNWYSTMWGFLFVAMQGLQATAFVIIVLALLSKRQPIQGTVTPSHFHDLGKLILMFVMLWAYFAFSQLLIVWAGNLSDEITWYLQRLHTSWGWLGVALIVFQFIVPFLLLLSRPLKRNPVLLACVVGIVLFMRFVDLLWIVLPSYYQHGFHFHWLNFSAPIGMGGLWVAMFLWELAKRPLLPVQAPQLEEALAHVE
jgi:hypothetical protein